MFKNLEPLSRKRSLMLCLLILPFVTLACQCMISKPKLSAAILSPQDGAVFKPGEMITFQGDNDVEAGCEHGQWSSSVDGLFGPAIDDTCNDTRYYQTGELSPGTHTITYTISEGIETATASISITILSEGQAVLPDPSEGTDGNEAIGIGTCDALSYVEVNIIEGPVAGPKKHGGDSCYVIYEFTNTYPTSTIVLSWRHDDPTDLWDPYYWIHPKL